MAIKFHTVVQETNDFNLLGVQDSIDNQMARALNRSLCDTRFLPTETQMISP